LGLFLSNIGEAKVLSLLGRKVILSIVAVLGACWVLFFLWLMGEQKKFLLSQLRYQAEGVYNYIALTRHWIASEGGIYVKKGGVYELITPSHFTKDVANYARGRLPYQVKVAVLGTKNPFHLPDTFEREAILKLQKAGEVWRVVSEGEERLFRFAAPLKFKKECSNCHEEYKGLKAQGCISISFPALPLFLELKRSRFYLGLYMVGSLLMVFGLLCVFFKSLVLDPLNVFVEASEKIEKGNMGIRVDLRRSDEWGRLAESFNKMLGGLAQHQKHLEEEVERATQELSRAYTDLKETERFRSEFFSNITHDLKTPITAIKGAVDLVVRKGGGRDPYVEIIRKNVEKLSKMINDLLDCARLESGQLELKKEPGDLVEVVEETVLLATPLAWNKGITISFNKEYDYLPMVFDGERISQVLVNLLTNAIKFSPKDKGILLGLRMENASVVVSVEDYGPGIPKEEWECVFEKFYCGEGASREGIGLGLAICKGIVEAHGGKIWISIPSHEGTIFSFSLPCQPEDE
jgi:signal transduction histidine kinase